MPSPAKSLSLQSKLALLEAVTDSIPESILLLTPDYKIRWGNKTARIQSGLTESDLVGQHCYAVTHRRTTPCKAPNDSCPLAHLLKTGRSKTMQHLHFNKDGGKLFVEIDVYPVKDVSGKIVELVHISRDITERVSMEAQIADKVVKLEESLARVKQLEEIIPICMYCKKVLDDMETWRQFEEYIAQYSAMDFRHGICSECYDKHVTKKKH